MKKISAGIIGLGTVGTGVARILLKNARLIEQRIGLPVVIKRIADLDIRRDRGIKLRKGLLTADAAAVVNDPEIDIVVELMGGLEPARTFMLQSIKNGKHVVTANKALLSKHGQQIFRAAAARGVEVAFEASVGGGIPVVRAVREGLASDRINSFFGILNGTANYILTRMTDEGGDFRDILKDAQAEGYAEADPTFDIEGIDTLHKLCVLVSLAYGGGVAENKIYTEGISQITPLDIEFARELGYRIKLLAICRGSGEEVDARVHPTLIPEDHLLAQVNDTLNALFVQSEDLGPTMFYGRGAGMMPTGSAVVADIMSIARRAAGGAAGRMPLVTGPAGRIRVKPFKEIQSRYYLRFSAVDKPGVLSKIAGILGRNNISIYSVVQKGRRIRGGSVPIFMLLHESREADIQKALQQINRLSILRQKTMLIRIEDGLSTQ